MQTNSEETLGAFLLPKDAEPEPEWEPPPWPDDCPKPGFYPGVPFDEYRAWRAANSSALKLGYQVSPKHMLAAINGELDTDSRARKFGRAIHTRLLEPASYKDSIQIAPPCCTPIKSGDRAGEPCGKASRFRDDDENWYCGTHAKGMDAVEPPDCITEEEAGRIERSVAEVFKHKVVGMVRQHGGCEVSMVWERDGLPCKGRLDKLIIDSNCPDTILDVKKGRSCKLTDSEVRKSIREYGWEAQAWWYRSGVKVLRPDKTAPLFAWVFLEDSPPFDVRPLWASSRMLEIGRAKATTAWDMYLRCVQSGEWPGYCTDIDELEPDDWELKRYSLL